MDQWDQWDLMRLSVHWDLPKDQLPPTDLTLPWDQYGRLDQTALLALSAHSDRLMVQWLRWGRWGRCFRSGRLDRMNQ